MAVAMVRYPGATSRAREPHGATHGRHLSLHRKSPESREPPRIDKVRGACGLCPAQCGEPSWERPRRDRRSGQGRGRACEAPLGGDRVARRMSRVQRDRPAALRSMSAWICLTTACKSRVLERPFAWVPWTDERHRSPAVVVDARLAHPMAAAIRRVRHAGGVAAVPAAREVGVIPSRPSPVHAVPAGARRVVVVIAGGHDRMVARGRLKSRASEVNASQQLP